MSTMFRLASIAAFAVVAAILASCSDRAAPDRHAFAWPYGLGDEPAARGGHTRGGPVTLAPSPSPQWTALQAAPPGMARDRAAILTLAGDFRVAFDFQELVGLRPGYHLAGPYQSWATERVFVLEDSAERISFQHQLVMVIVDESGKAQPPEVIKHWRQDWTWQGRTALRYAGPDGAGDEHWRHEALSAEAVAGAWVWSVWNNDDGPRYTSIGRWRHEANGSRWDGDDAWRPLPRREKTARKDYQVLVGGTRIIVAPDGWVMFQDNGKLILDGAGQPVAGEAMIAREIGVERYQRIVGFDWAPGIAAWKAELPYWTALRKNWDEVLAAPAIRLGPPPDGGALVMTLLEEAQASAAGDAAALARGQTALRGAAAGK